MEYKDGTEPRKEQAQQQGPGNSESASSEEFERETAKLKRILQEEQTGRQPDVLRLKNELEKANANGTESEKLVHELRSEKGKLATEVDKLKSKVEEVENDNDMVRGKLSKSEEIFQQKQNEIQKLKDEYERMKREKEQELEDTRQEANAKLMEESQNLLKSQTEVERLLAECSRLSDQNVSISNELARETEKSRGLRNQFDNQSKKNENDLQELQAHEKDANEKIHHLESEKSRLEKNVTEEKQKSVRFEEAYQKLNDTNEVLVNKCEQFERKNSKLVGERDAMRVEKDDVDQKCEQLERKNSKLAVERDAMRVEKDDVDQKCEQLERKNSKLAADRDAMRVEKENVDKKCEQLVQKIQGLTEQIKDLNQENEEITPERDDLKSTLEDERKAKAKLTKEWEKMKMQLNNKIDDLRTQRNELEDELNYQLKKINKLKDQLEWWKRIDCTMVVPSSCNENGTAADLMDQLLDHLKANKARVELKVKQGSTISKQDGVVVVPCIAASSLESDVDAALQSTQLGQYVRTVLIMYHHVAPEKSRSMATSTQELLAHKYPQCDVIYDVFFWQKDLYQCKNNELFLDNFERFLSK